MKVGILILSIVSLGAIGASASWIYPPAGPLAVGCLLWIELIRYASRVSRKDSGK